MHPTNYQGAQHSLIYPTDVVYSYEPPGKQRVEGPECIDYHQFGAS